MGSVRSETVRAVLEGLRGEYPAAECALLFETPFQLLVATILSAQCTDERVNRVTRGLFQKWGTADVLAEAARWCQESELILAIGSSLVVTPAADLPREAKHAGARLVIVNRDPTPLDSLADAVISESIGPTLTEIDAYLG